VVKKSCGRGWRRRAASGVEAAVAEGGNDPAYPGSTVALCSPCLIVMDEPRSLARSDIRVRRVMYAHKPGGNHLSTPESGGCSCLPCLLSCHIYIYTYGAGILRTAVDAMAIFMNTRGMRTARRRRRTLFLVIVNRYISEFPPLSNGPLA